MEVSQTGSRATAILDAVRRQIDERRDMLDRAQDVGAVTIVVRLHAGTTRVKTVTWTEERITLGRSV